MSMRDASEAGTTRDPSRRGLPRHAPRVLMYHYFGDAPGADPERLFVTRRMFSAQLDHLQRRGWQALTLDEYLAALDGAPTPRRSYLLTIDDGHESVASIAAPVLAAAGIPSVLFGPTGAGLHGLEEWVDVQSVLKCRDALVNLARAWCNS